MANDPNKPKSSGSNPSPSEGSGGGRPQSENDRIRQRRAERRAQEEAAASASASKAESATSRTALRRQEREQEKQRRRLTTSAIVIGLIALLIAVAVIATQTPADAPIPDYALTRYEGIPTTTTQSGYPRLGSPDANVIVVEYSSFDCASCLTFHTEAMDGIIERVRAGNVAYIFAPRFGTGGIVNGQGAAEAALCAGEQGRFWQMHDALFNWHATFGNQAFTNNRITTGVSALNLNRGNFDGCVRLDSTVGILDRARQEAITAGFVGTPAFTINGIQPVNDEGLPLVTAPDILAAIDTALAQFSTTPTGADAQATIETVVPEATPESTSSAEVTPDTSAAGSDATPEATPNVEITPDTSAAGSDATPEATPNVETTPEATPESA